MSNGLRGDLLSVGPAATNNQSGSQFGANTLSLEDPESMDHEFMHHASYLARPRVPRKTIIITFLLVVIGITCISFGIERLAQGADNGFALLFVGLLVIVPGGYQAHQLYRACRRRPGFSFEHLEDEDIYST